MLLLSILKSLKTLIPLLTKFRRFSFRERRDFAIQDQLNSLSPLYKELTFEFHSNIQEMLTLQKEMLSLLQEAFLKASMAEQELEQTKTNQSSPISTIPNTLMSFKLSDEILEKYSVMENVQARLKRMDDASNKNSNFLKSKSGPIMNRLPSAVYKKVLFDI